MSYSERAGTARRTRSTILAALVVVSAALIGHESLAASSSSATSRRALRLCQIYRNEPWHYELRPAAVGHGCPPMYADPTHDPRMQQ